jgi:hypothetical protein
MMSSITIELPQSVLQDIQLFAELLQQPVEQLVIQSVLGNLPPLVELAQPDLKLALLALHGLGNRELGAIARAIHPQCPAFEGAVVLKQAYARRILRWRGYDWTVQEDGESGGSENPWMEFVGMFAGDSDFAALAADLRAERSLDVMDAA